MCSIAAAAELQRNPHVDVHHPMETFVPVRVLVPGLPCQNAGAVRHGMDALAREEGRDERIVRQVALHHGAEPAGP